MMRTGNCVAEYCNGEILIETWAPEREGVWRMMLCCVRRGSFLQRITVQRVGSALAGLYQINFVVVQVWCDRRVNPMDAFLSTPSCFLIC